MMPRHLFPDENVTTMVTLPSLEDAAAESASETVGLDVVAVQVTLFAVVDAELIVSLASRYAVKSRTSVFTSFSSMSSMGSPVRSRRTL